VQCAEVLVPLLHGGLRPLPLRDVADHHLHRALPLLVEGGRGHFDVDGRPVQSHEAFLDQGDVAAFAKPLESGEHTRTGVGMDELQDRLAHDILIRGRAEELDRRRVGEDDHALLVDHDAVRRDLDEPPAPFLGLAQRVFGPLALGHVPWRSPGC